MLLTALHPVLAWIAGLSSWAAGIDAGSVIASIVHPDPKATGLTSFLRAKIGPMGHGLPAKLWFNRDKLVLCLDVIARCLSALFRSETGVAADQFAGHSGKFCAALPTATWTF